MAHSLHYFFSVWDCVEQTHPWGVECLQPFMSGFDIPEAMCEEIDSRLFFDLMISLRPETQQRLKIEGRHTGVVYWAKIDYGVGAQAVVSFQTSPAAPFHFSTSVDASPRAVVGVLVGYHRVLLVGVGRICRGGWMVGRRRRSE
jgi:hypothetical protein